MMFPRFSGLSKAVHSWRTATVPVTTVRPRPRTHPMTGHVAPCAALRLACRLYRLCRGLHRVGQAGGSALAGGRQHCRPYVHSPLPTIPPGIAPSLGTRGGRRATRVYERARRIAVDTEQVILCSRRWLSRLMQRIYTRRAGSVAVLSVCVSGGYPAWSALLCGHSLIVAG
jgi:hypothetical protein